jgi:hypothetical protein
MPYQRGGGLGSLFRGIFRVLMPVLKRVGKSVGKQALTTGAQIASDLVAGDSIKASAKKRGRSGAASLFQKAAGHLQEGEGLGRRPAKRHRTPPLAKAKKRKTKVEDQLGFYYK